MTRMLALAITGLILSAGAGTAAEAPTERAASLRGLPGMMVQQHTVAVQHGLVFARTPADIARLVEAGSLVHIPGDANYTVAGAVRWPFAQPEMQVFLERIAAGYRAACGEKLVVTSLTRAISQQPRNAHALSVHPTGIAVDLRISTRAECRQWLEGKLLDMEEAGALHAIREKAPPHYHVALFPGGFADYLAEVQAATPSADAGVVAAYLAAAAAEQGSVDDAAVTRRGGIRSMLRVLRVLDPRPLLGLA
jgi:hypothetical protein